MFEKDTAAGHLLILKLNETILKAGIIATRGGWPDSPFADKAEMLAVRKGVAPNRTAPGARANVAPTPTTPEGSGGSDQVCIRQGPAGVSGESGAQETRANKRTPRIVGVRKALGISIRPILPFHRSTRL